MPIPPTKGHEVGPPLGSITNKPDEAILVDLLDPSASIQPEFASYIVVTNRGAAYSGVLVSESPTSVTLRGEKGVTESVLREDIALMEAASVSAMPSNLHEQITPRGAADLLAYLRRAVAAED